MIRAPPPFREGTSSAGAGAGILARMAFSHPYSCGTAPDFRRGAVTGFPVEGLRIRAKGHPCPRGLDRTNKV